MKCLPRVQRHSKQREQLVQRTGEASSTERRESIGWGVQGGVRIEGRISKYAQEERRGLMCERNVLELVLYISHQAGNRGPASVEITFTPHDL